MEEQQELNFGIEDVKIVPEEIEAGIIGLNLRTAKEIYGEAALKPDQIKLVIRLENKEFGVETEIPISFYEKGQITNKTYMGKIIKRYSDKYGSDWRLNVGSRIILIGNTKGYWDIKL